MTRSNIDRLKQFSELANKYAQSVREEKRDYFNTTDAQEARNELNKRYVELRDLIVESEGGIPLVSILGGQPVEVFRMAFSSANITGAFHALKNVPDVLARAVAFHGGKRAQSNPGKADEHSEAGLKTYIKIDIIEAFEIKEGPFNYQKLVKLLRQINDNYGRGNEHACSQLLKATLNHIPPLLGYKTFEELSNNYKWSSDAHKTYAHLLNEWTAEAHDVTHTYISDRDDLFTTEDLPPPIRINTILQECQLKTVEDIPKFEKK